MNDERINTFSERLNEYMTEYGVLSVDLAKQFGVSRSTISQYLKGTILPKRNRLVEIADALNINPLWLMGYDVPMESKKIVSGDLTHDEQEIIEAYRAASDDIKGAVRAVLNVKG